MACGTAASMRHAPSVRAAHAPPTTVQISSSSAVPGPDATPASAPGPAVTQAPGQGANTADAEESGDAVARDVGYHPHGQAAASTHSATRVVSPRGARSNGATVSAGCQVTTARHSSVGAGVATPPCEVDAPASQGVAGAAAAVQQAAAEGLAAMAGAAHPLGAGPATPAAAADRSSSTGSSSADSGGTTANARAARHRAPTGPEERLGHHGRHHLRVPRRGVPPSPRARPIVLAELYRRAGQVPSRSTLRR